jgi:U2 small nuclear ribonucleoprotein B''
MDRCRNTVYLRNLVDSVSIGELRRSLYELCTEYGVVLDIVADKSEKLRGQAFVVFRDEMAASSALQQLNGTSFYGKTIAAQYARRPSTCAAATAIRVGQAA